MLVLGQVLALLWLHPYYSCNAGQYSANGSISSCMTCAIGKFTAVTGATLCTNCPPGKWVGNVGAKLCKAIKCQIGFLNVPGSSKCVLSMWSTLLAVCVTVLICLLIYKGCMFWNRKKNDSCTIEENDSMKNEQLLRNETQTILDDDLYKSIQ